MNIKKRAVALILSAVLLFSCMPLVSYAANTDDFISLVESIDPTLSYADRMETAEAAGAKYNSLSAKEREGVSAYYALYLQELDALREIEEKAEEFLAIISELEDATSLYQKEGIAARATATGVYFSDVSFPGVKGAIEKINEITSAVDACHTFMDAVGELADISPDDYPAFRAKLDEALAARDGIDTGYPGVAGAIESYGILAGKVSESEEFTEITIELMDELEFRVNYAERKRLYNDISQRMANSTFLDEYEGVAELKETMSLLADYLSKCESDAAAFVLAYRSISSADSLFLGLCNALEASVGIDSSVVGVADALSALERAVEDYNDTAESINSLFSGM